MVPLSVLDLVPIVEGGNAAQALAHSLDLARNAERWSYRRYWIAEHHNMPGVASSATAVVIGHIAGGTSKLRVGAGGIMLPNHAPLVIAEQFGTLASLYPGRIELGLGRAPGTDPLTMRALRRSRERSSFESDVAELMRYFESHESAPLVRAIPGEGLKVPIWILGSSLFGAGLAARLGLPFAFASHFAPAHLFEAVELYRTQFRASEALEHPYVMLGVHAFAADTDEEAELWQSSIQQAFVHLQRGRPRPLSPPRRGFLNELEPVERRILEQTLRCSLAGSRASVKAQMQSFVERTRPDELIVSSMIYDHQARLRSYEILAEVRDELSGSSR